MSIKTIDMEDYKKKYEEALERAKDQLEKLKVVNVHGDVLEYIFPELAEPGDEKIRKELIDFFSASHATDTFRGISWDRVVSWLEKQCEDIDNSNKEYWRGYREGKQEVLDKYTELKKQGEQKPYGQRKECTDCQFNYAGECKGFCAMKRGEQKPAEVRTTGYWNVQDIEQKPAWSEEDMAIIDDAIFFIQEFQKSDRCKNESDMQNSVTCERFLIFLKDKVAPQSKQEWSEDVEAAISLLKDIAEEQEKDYCPYNAKDLRKAAQYLETCRPQNRWKPSDEQMELIKDIVFKDRQKITRKELVIFHSIYNDLKKLREE